jgi:hypothetical protein
MMPHFISLYVHLAPWIRKNGSRQDLPQGHVPCSSQMNNRPNKLFESHIRFSFGELPTPTNTMQIVGDKKQSLQLILLRRTEFDFSDSLA